MVKANKKRRKEGKASRFRDPEYLNSLSTPELLFLSVLFGDDAEMLVRILDQRKEVVRTKR